MNCLKTNFYIQEVVYTNFLTLSAKKLVFEYIEAFYNTVRTHSHCGYKSPNQYETQYLQKAAKLVG